MPSSATITAFYTFAAGQRPRVGQVNSNFANLRGHLISIDPNSATASISGLYDLGSTEYRWRTAYVSKLDVSVTSTAALTLEAVAANEFNFKNSATTTTFRITPTGYVGQNTRACAGITTVAAIADVAASPVMSYATSGTGNLAGSTCTLSTNGRPVLLTLGPDINTSTAGPSGVLMDMTGVGTGIYHQTRIVVQRGGVAIAATDIKAKYVAGSIIQHFPSDIRFFDFVAAGTYNYSLNISILKAYEFNMTNAADVVKVQFKNVKLFAAEM